MTRLAVIERSEATETLNTRTSRVSGGTISMSPPTRLSLVFHLTVLGSSSLRDCDAVTVKL
jgi:hypothetical protein